jgi:hypothetical protein
MGSPRHNTALTPENFMRHLRHLALGLSLMTVLSAAALAAEATSYTIPVRLNNGKQVTCAVNAPASRPADSDPVQTLNRSEVNEAEHVACW